jgi:hypothetical protein
VSGLNKFRQANRQSHALADLLVACGGAARLALFPQPAQQRVEGPLQQLLPEGRVTPGSGEFGIGHWREAFHRSNSNEGGFAVSDNNVTPVVASLPGIFP